MSGRGEILAIPRLSLLKSEMAEELSKEEIDRRARELAQRVMAKPARAAGVAEEGQTYQVSRWRFQAR